MSVTVGKLKKWLSEYPDDMPVVLSSDAEGNTYKYLAQYADLQIKEDGYHLEMYDSHDFDYYSEGYEGEELEELKEELEALPKVVVLWPV